jgi:ubiquinone/menaquinone biosynthesis C-methylase UbiE
MKINYQETTTDLQKRIDIHNQFGGRDIDRWMLEILTLQKGMKILDESCGSGKQCFSFYDHLGGDCDITGGDVSIDLLDQARKESQKRGAKIQFTELDFNKPFPYEENVYDLVSCCFAIYYAENIPFTIREMHRILKQGGTLFTSGPMPDNKKLFYDIIKEATQKTIPAMPGSSRYSTEILCMMQGLFSKVDVCIFENPLTFESVEPFLQYTRASLSEDRKLWKPFFADKEEFEQIMIQIEKVANKRLEKEGKLVMTKVVGGFLATK